MPELKTCKKTSLTMVEMAECESRRRLSGHIYHCPDCDVHLTSLLLCPECGTRWTIDGHPQDFVPVAAAIEAATEEVE